MQWHLGFWRKIGCDLAFILMTVKNNHNAHEFADSEYIPDQFAFNIPGDLEYSQHAIKVEIKQALFLLYFCHL